MPDNSIFYFSEDVDYEFNDSSANNLKLIQIADKEKVSIDFLNYIFCSDPYLLDLNKKYLDHDYFTDIISFESSEEMGVVSGDIFISVDRAKENADLYKVSFDDEIKRLMIHGLLHLIGYKDESDDEKLLMRKKEDYYLSLCPKDK